MDLEPLQLPAVEVVQPPKLAALYGKDRQQPHWEVKTEQPWHRAAAFMFAQGATAVDVAENLGHCPTTVQNLLRQPWFQETVTTLMAENGGKDIMALFRAEQFNSLVTLVELRDNPKVPAATRKACATDILDRALGKALVRVETSSIPTSSNPADEVKQLEAQLSRLTK